MIRLRSPEPGPLFSFIFTNDFHVSTQEDASFLGQAVQEWNRKASTFDFVVVGGDLVNSGTKREFRRVKARLDSLKNPYFLVPGNHDVTGPGRSGQKAIRSVFSGWKNNMLIHHRGVVLILLDITNGKNAHTTVSEETTRWLQRMASRISELTPVIVFTHFSLHPDVPRFPVGNAADVFDILDEKKVIASFSGHYHGYWEGWRNGAKYFTNTCLSRSQGNHDNTEQEGYLEVSVFPADVRVEFRAFPHEQNNP